MTIKPLVRFAALVLALPFTFASVARASDKPTQFPRSTQNTIERNDPQPQKVYKRDEILTASNPEWVKLKSSYADKPDALGFVTLAQQHFTSYSKDPNWVSKDRYDQWEFDTMGRMVTKVIIPHIRKEADVVVDDTLDANARTVQHERNRASFGVSVARFQQDEATEFANSELGRRIDEADLQSQGNLVGKNPENSRWQSGDHPVNATALSRWRGRIAGSQILTLTKESATWAVNPQRPDLPSGGGTGTGSETGGPAANPNNPANPATGQPGNAAPQPQTGPGNTSGDAPGGGVGAPWDRFLQVGESVGVQGTVARGVYELEKGNFSQALKLASRALVVDPKNANALAVFHSAKDRAAGIAVGASGGAAASAGAAALRGGGVPGFVSDASSARPSAEIAGLAASGALRLSADQALTKARSALSLNDTAIALDTLTKALEQDPNNPALLSMRATVYGRLGRWEEALQDVKAGLALAPGNRALLTTKAIAENRTRRWTDALATATEMLAADPNNAWAYAARAHAYGGLGRKDDMMRDILRAAALDAHFEKAAADAANLQLPSDADIMFLFPGESAKSATRSAPAGAGRGRSFGVLGVAGVAGGLLLALGLLSIVMEPVKNAVTAVFTKRGESRVPAVATAQPASVAGNVGGLIRGQYQILRQIGAGGMGLVFEGTDKSLGRRVAIKKMRDELRLNARERDRFIIEAKTVASLHHPNIVDIYAIAEEGEDVYLVFEYVDGKTVHDLVQTAGRLAPAEAVSVTRAMGEALTYAHAHGVIHRDMKPSNVMRTASGQIKVMDFGIARMAKDALTRYSMTNTVVGTPPYMAPEQEQGVVRKESDVYALAICSYEMLTGKLPFIGMGAGMLMNKINMSYIPPSRAIAGLPEGLDEVFLKAFQADPEKRYRTPQEFVAALGGTSLISSA